VRCKECGVGIKVCNEILIPSVARDLLREVRTRE
jgi:hypothetical protein